MSRLFIALRPPAEVVEKLVAVQSSTPDVRWVPADQLHVTLQFLGDGDPDELTAELGRAQFCRCEVTLGREVELLGDRALVLPAAGVDHLAASVTEATQGHGSTTNRDFMGHLTLGRIRARTGGAGSGANSVIVRPSFPGPSPLCWIPTELELVESVLGSLGAVHDVIARFALRNA